MRDELLNETLFLSMTHARVEIAAWVEDCNRERPHAAPGYAALAAFAAQLDEQWAASTAPMRKTPARLLSQLWESWAARHVCKTPESQEPQPLNPFRNGLAGESSTWANFL